MAKKLNPNITFVKDVSELPKTEGLNGNLLVYDGNVLKKISSDKLQNLVAGISGTLKMSDPAPKIKGKYELTDLGTYTNLVPIIPFGSTTAQPTPIITEDGYYNAVYFDGGVFTQIKMKLPKMKLNEDGGALGYDLATDVFDIVKEVTPSNDISFDNKTTGMFTKTERLATYPNFQAINYTYQYTWKNYDVSNFKYLKIINGLIFRDGNAFQGLVGVKANGTVVNLLDANGITGNYPIITNKTFNITDFVSISGTLDENTGSPSFSGVLSASEYQSVKCIRLDNLEKLIGNGVRGKTIFVDNNVYKSDGTLMMNSDAWGRFKVIVKKGDVVKVGLYGNPNVIIGLKYDNNENLIGNYGKFTGADADYHEYTYNVDFDGFLYFHSRIKTGDKTYAYAYDVNGTDISSVLNRLLNSGTSTANLRSSILANTPEPVLGIVGDSQESSVVQLNGKTFFYHTSGWGNEFIMAYDYDIETNTVSNGVKAIDGSKTGLSSTTHKCSNIFAFNGVIYALVSLWNPQNGVSLLKSTDGKNFTLVKNNFENGFFTGLNGNHCFVPEKINGYYYYFTEGRDGGDIWITKVFRTKDDNLETANFEYLGVANGLRTENGMAGGPSIHYQDGIFKCFYHYGPDGNLPTYLAYAEADLQNPTQFRPVYRPFLSITTNPFPVTDQIADPEIYELNGQCYMFAEFVDNTNGKTSVFRWKCAEGRLGEILRRKI